MPIRIFIVDQQEVVRAGLSRACSQIDDIEVIGEAGSLTDAYSAILQCKPNVIVTDWRDTGEQPINTLTMICQSLSQTRVLIFTATDTPELASTLIRSGASGYLVKDASLGDVLTAIRAIHSGRIFISHSAVGSPAARGPLGNTKHQKMGLLAQPDLSGREREVIEHLSQGFTNKQVAEKLFLSVKTVETYRSRVMKKHGLSNRADLFRFAQSHLLTQ